jgi:hypothetical protein
MGYIICCRALFIGPYYSHSYFEEEEVDLNEWATSWLQYLLAKELTFDNLVRLWGKNTLLQQSTMIKMTSNPSIS